MDIVEVIIWQSPRLAVMVVLVTRNKTEMVLVVVSENQCDAARAIEDDGRSVVVLITT